jgi:hypothetical protein
LGASRRVAAVLELSAVSRETSLSDDVTKLVAKVVPSIAAAFPQSLAFSSNRVPGVSSVLRGEQERDACADSQTDSNAEREGGCATMVGCRSWCGRSGTKHAGGRGVRGGPKGDESRVVRAFAARSWAGV